MDLALKPRVPQLELKAGIDAGIRVRYSGVGDVQELSHQRDGLVAITPAQEVNAESALRRKIEAVRSERDIVRGPKRAAGQLSEWHHPSPTGEIPLQHDWREPAAVG